MGSQRRTAPSYRDCVTWCERDWWRTRTGARRRRPQMGGGDEDDDGGHGGDDGGDDYGRGDRAQTPEEDYPDRRDSEEADSGLSNCVGALRRHEYHRHGVSPPSVLVGEVVCSYAPTELGPRYGNGPMFTDSAACARASLGALPGCRTSHRHNTGQRNMQGQLRTGPRGQSARLLSSRSGAGKPSHQQWTRRGFGHGRTMWRYPRKPRPSRGKTKEASPPVDADWWAELVGAEFLGLQAPRAAQEEDGPAFV